MPSRRRKPPDDTPPPGQAPDDTPPPPGPAPDDDEFFEVEEELRLHEAYVEYRVAGGAPSTPEAYRRAAEQFDRLPGAIRSRPGVGQAPPPRPATSAPGHEPRDDEAGGDS